MPVSLEENME
jgi:hypothetical protein